MAIKIMVPNNIDLDLENSKFFEFETRNHFWIFSSANDLIDKVEYTVNKNTVNLKYYKTNIKPELLREVRTACELIALALPTVEEDTDIWFITKYGDTSCIEAFEKGIASTNKHYFNVTNTLEVVSDTAIYNLLINKCV